LASSTDKFSAFSYARLSEFKIIINNPKIKLTNISQDGIVISQSCIQLIILKAIKYRPITILKDVGQLHTLLMVFTPFRYFLIIGDFSLFAKF